MAGTKTSGRRSLSDGNIQEFKRLAWNLIVKRCSQKGQRGEDWIDKYIPLFANKLMPQVVEGGGENGAIVLELKNSQYDSIIAREAAKAIARTASDN